MDSRKKHGKLLQNQDLQHMQFSTPLPSGPPLTQRHSALPKKPSSLLCRSTSASPGYTEEQSIHLKPGHGGLPPCSMGQVPSSSSSPNLVIFNTDLSYYRKLHCLLFSYGRTFIPMQFCKIFWNSLLWDTVHSLSFSCINSCTADHIKNDECFSRMGNSRSAFGTEGNRSTLELAAS